MADVMSRFLRYVTYDTQSDEASDCCPSTEKQRAFAELLTGELRELGLDDAAVDENGYVMATLPTTMKRRVPTVGFIAHLDTSPDTSGCDVRPRIVENYSGGEIVLDRANNIILSPTAFPELQQYIGETLITTDGTTLLGADNKAGVAEIISAVERLVRNPRLKHGTVKIAFTPDEEIGRGADRFDTKKFGADVAYTIDGGELGELEFENFNAAKAIVTISGRNVHPGTAKHKMINSMLIAMEFNAMLPTGDVPALTEQYEGFFHLTNIGGNVEQTRFQYIVRDHDREKFKRRKTMLRKIASLLNHRYGTGTVKLKLVDQYYNMREKIEPVMHVVDIAAEAMRDAGVEPKITPIRGGTDGARLSFMGLPTPNIFAGGHNYHGKHEYIPVGSMKKAVEVIYNIVKRYAAKR